MVVVHPYLSNHAASDSFLFPEMNQDLKRRHTADVAEVQRESLVASGSISFEEFR
jgi:hypothetical protein